jgi:carboxyl-terminal processing protease
MGRRRCGPRIRPVRRQASDAQDLARPWQRDLLHLLVGTACGLSLGLVLHRIAPRAPPSDAQRFTAVEQFVRDLYVRELDGRALTDAALRGMVESLDPYSRYYSREELAAMERETSGHFRGIGVVFARPIEEGRILFSMPDSPADRAGIGVGDRFLEIDGHPLAGLEAAQIHRLLAEAPEEEDAVQLRVRSRDGTDRSLALERIDLVDPTVRHARLLDSELGVGYLAITSFSQETPKEFDAAIGELKRRGLKGLVVDVRGNLGGVLRSAVTLANRFVPSGLIVSQEGRGVPLRYEAEASEAWYADLPLAVLVDGESASASEVFAAALQEHRAAVVVGTPSYGKGMVQQVRTFGDEAAVKLTTAYYYTPSGRNLERTVEKAWETGVVPDLAVALTEAERREVARFRESYGPPPEDRAAIEAWESAEGTQLLPREPPDAQLDAALALFRGQKPGPRLAEAGK